MSILAINSGDRVAHKAVVKAERQVQIAQGTRGGAWAVLLAWALWAITGPALAQDAGRATMPAGTRPAEQPSANPRGAAPSGQARPAELPPVNALAVAGADYRLGPNDLIDLDVFAVPDLKRTVRVNASGLVSVPMVGAISVLGLTAQEAEERIAQALGEKYLQNPQVSVFVREFTTQRITIEGAVVRPGIYPVVGQVSLLKALALAGGIGQLANYEEVTVFRAGKDGKTGSLVYDVERIREGTLPDPEVLPEDVIVVKRDPRRTVLRDSLFRDVIDAINPFSVFAK